MFRSKKQFFNNNNNYFMYQNNILEPKYQKSKNDRASNVQTLRGGGGYSLYSDDGDDRRIF